DEGDDGYGWAAWRPSATAAAQCPSRRARRVANDIGEMEAVPDLMSGHIYKVSSHNAKRGRSKKAKRAKMAKSEIFAIFALFAIFASYSHSNERSYISRCMTVLIS